MKKKVLLGVLLLAVLAPLAWLAAAKLADEAPDPRMQAFADTLKVDLLPPTEQNGYYAQLGFGVKGHVYPEELLIPFLARTMNRPVRWIEDRHEHFMAACHSRDQIQGRRNLLFL